MALRPQKSIAFLSIRIKAYGLQDYVNLYLAKLDVSVCSKACFLFANSCFPVFTISKD